MESHQNGSLYPAGPKNPSGHPWIVISYPLNAALMPMPSIAAVIPLYNGAAFIEEALDSVLAQKTPCKEIIVVDDGSDDNGPDIVRKMISRGKKFVLLSKKNGGQGSARNYGIRHAQSHLIAFLDQDDIWYPNHNAVLIEPFKRRGKSNSLGWVNANTDAIDVHGRTIVRRLQDGLNVTHPKRTLEDCLQNDMQVVPGATIVSKKAVLQIGGFDERLRGYEDDDLFMRMFVAGYVNIYLNDPVLKWRRHDGSCGNSRLFAESRIIYCRKLLDNLSSVPEIGTFLALDVIRQRFWNQLMSEYEKDLVKHRDRRRAIVHLEGLRAFFPHIRPAVRPFYKVLVAALGCRGAYILWPITSGMNLIGR